MPKFALTIAVILVLSLMGIEGETVGLSGEAIVTLTDSDATVDGGFSVETIDDFNIQVFGDGSTEIGNDGTVVLPSTNRSTRVKTTESDTLEKIAQKRELLNQKIQRLREELDSIQLQTAEQESSNRVLRRSVENLESQVTLQESEAANLEKQLLNLRRSLTSHLDVSAIGKGDVPGQAGLVSVQNNVAPGKLSLINALSFALVAALLVMSPGPNGVLIAKTVPTSGKAAGFANVAGFVAAFNLHGTLSILGISAILLASPQAFFIVKILGAAYLCWVGFKALRDAYQGNNTALAVEPANRQRTLRLAFVEGLLTNVLNPKTSMFYLAAFPQFIPTGSGAAASAFLLVFLHTIINVIWFGAMVVLFTRITKVGQNASFQRWLKGFTGAVFVGFGVKLATYRA